ncbi:MAG: tRNA dihydrouridine synthase DusB [Parcubacteria group bacterium CG10_big_fil_rev_8_21_14_0_10_36_14]|nr:MAG: tRNA dihydrouridine synthase DusB [Parcubacteria group bacterium CG10_big_fil_rev_8_21_14_0_10_36_14]
MKFNWKKIKKPIVALSPMADYTDSAFCLICKKFGVDLVYREMVSADAVVYENKKTLEMARFNKRERPIILQIFGKDPEIMSRAARILEKRYKPDGIDINMGCPAKKIVGSFMGSSSFQGGVSGGSGASLMKDAKLAGNIVRAVKNAVKVPVSVKTRLGWENPSEILRFAPAMERAGADAIAIHGRTKAQGYNRKANWEIIRKVCRKLEIPVLINGDIIDAESFRKAIEISGASGALIGRGALGNPMIFKNIKNKNNINPTHQEIKKIILEHAKLHLKEHGEIITLRKHLVYYVKGISGAKDLRKRLVAVKSIKDLQSALSELR